MNKYIISPLLLTLALQGCGGSDPVTPPAVETPVERTFTLNAQITNDCGISTAFTGVELLLQDDTWQTIRTYRPDETGLISFITTSEFINYTLVAEDQRGSDRNGLNVVSFYQAASNTPSHYQARYDELVNNSSCECVTQNLELSHRPFATQTSVTSSLSFDSWQAVDGSTTLFEGVKVCRAVDGDWPLHSFSVSGTDANDRNIASADFISDFSVDASGVWELSAFQVADELSLPISHQAFSTNQLIGNTAHFSELISEDMESLLAFNTHSYISESFYHSKASIAFDESSSFLGSSVVKTHHQILSTESSEALAVSATTQKPAIDDVNFTEIKQDGSYSYSAVAGYPFAIISFTFTAYDPETNLLMPAKWTFYGPSTGTLAISGPLTGYEDIIGTATTKKAVDVRLLQSNLTNTYSTYVQYFQSMNALDMNNELVNNLREVEVNFTRN